MGAINIGAKNGGRVKVVAPDNPAVGTEAILPKESGTLATIEDVNRITKLAIKNTKIQELEDKLNKLEKMIK